MTDQHEEKETGSCCSDTDTETTRETNEALNESHTETTEYRVYGVDCPSCASSIEKSLQKVKGIFQADVSYATGKLRIVGSGTVPDAHIVDQVEKLGFRTEPINEPQRMMTYKVEGMDCGNCALGIEKHLNALTEVQEAHVYFSTGQMKLAHTLSDDTIAAEVGKLGYTITPITHKHESDAPEKQNRFAYGSIVMSAVLIAAGFAGRYMATPEWLTTLLFAAAIVLSGRKPVKSAFYSVISRSLDMNVLMSMAAIGAAIIGEWFEGAMVVWLFSLGNVLQDRSMEQTRQSIRGLMDMAPSKAWVKTDEGLVEKAVEAIVIGDEIVVKPGDRVPLDGIVRAGETSVNQAPITGESIPIDKTTGDTVYAGSINESGSLDIEVTKHVQDTTLSNIIHMVEEAQEKRAPSQAFVDKFAAIYTPIVFALALAVIILPPLFGFGSWGEWAYRGLTLLIVACPCALVISTPVAIVSAIGNAAKEGVLIKGGTFLEKAGHIKAIAFDKTGTLTEGKPDVTDVEPISETHEELLSVVRTLEEYSTHPIAKTIVTHAREQDIQSKPGTLFKNLTGRGVQATIADTVYYAGNQKLFTEMNMLPDEVRERVGELEQQGKTIVIIGSEAAILGIIAVADTIRKTTVDALDGLKRIGIKQVVMLTGDQEGTAKNIAQAAHVNRYFAELMPEDKVSAIKQLQQEGYQVAMVGDGINDAPALATSELGIAMGGAGTDTAMETADIVLMADNLEKLPHTIRLSRKALRIIKQNVWFSLLIKFAALALIVPGWLTLWLAVISDTGAAIIVILNSLRLLKLN